MVKPVELEKGSSYLLIDNFAIPVNAYTDYIKPYIEHGVPARIVSGMCPEKLKKDVFKNVDLKRVDFKWWSELARNIDANTTKNLNLLKPEPEHLTAALSNEPPSGWGLENMPKKADSGLYLKVFDGLENAVHYEDTEMFNKYLRVIKNIADTTATGKSVFIVLVQKDAFDREKLAFLGRNGLEPIVCYHQQ
jgi:hypothetical protein